MLNNFDKIYTTTLITGLLKVVKHGCYLWSRYYYTSVSFFLYKNMAVVLLLHPKTNCMTIPPVVNCGKF
jgi:hypothetical protein